MPTMLHDNNDSTSVFDIVSKAVLWHFEVWFNYKYLYTSKELGLTRIQEDYSLASAFFRELFIREIIMSISRLLDPKLNGKYKNASLYQLLSLVDQVNDASLFSLLKNNLEESKRLSNPLLVWRNKRLAHIDLNSHNPNYLGELPVILFDSVEKLSSNFVGFINEYTLHYHNKLWWPGSLALNPELRRIVQLLQNSF